MKNYYGMLSEIENILNNQKCWIDLLNEHCEINEVTDTHLLLLINLINEYNEKILKFIEKHLTEEITAGG